MRPAIPMQDVVKGLGAPGWSPWSATCSTVAGRNNRAPLERFFAATNKAEKILVNSPAEWQRLAPRIGVTDAGALDVYRRRFLEGLPQRPLADEVADARALYHVLAEIGGTDLVGPSRDRSRHVLWRRAERMNLAPRLVSIALLLVAWLAGSHIIGTRLLPEPQTVWLASSEKRGPARSPSISVSRSRASPCHSRSQ